MKTLLQYGQEALAAHKLARSQMTDKVEINIYFIQERRLSLVRFQEPEDNLSQENEAKTRRTLCYYQSTETGDL